MIKVSVIVPVYNTEKYLDRCIKSLVNQTLKDIEIILVDDKSPDNSPRMCDEYSKKDRRIKVIHKEKNEGLGYARNSGMTIATGEYIGFVDSDDYIDLDYYEKLYNQAKKSLADVCYAGNKEFKATSKGNDINLGIKISLKEKVIDVEKVLLNIMDVDVEKHCIGMSVWRAIFKANIIKDNNIQFLSEREYVSEDILFDFDFLKHSKRATFVNDTYYYYCFNEISLTKTYRKDRFEKTKQLHNKLNEKSEGFQNKSKIKEGIDKLFIMNVRFCIKFEKLNSKKVAIENIDKVCNDSRVKQAIKKVKGSNFRQKLFNFLIKHKQSKIIYAMIKI